MTSIEKKMKYVRLGKSGLKFSKVILGCMSYGNPKWNGNWVLEEEESSKHIKAAYDAGINTFDTANVYSAGISEEVLETFMFPGAAADAAGYVNQYGLSVAKNQGWSGSVRPLSVKTYHFLNWPLHPAFCIIFSTLLQYSSSDVYSIVKVATPLKSYRVIRPYSHRFDTDTPIEETMQALHDVVKAGYVRYIGMSSCYAWQFHVMQSTHSANFPDPQAHRDILDYAIANNLTPFISMQNHHNLLYREEEREMFPTVKHFGVGAIPWSPLARGALTRPLDVQEQRKRAASDSVEEIAKKREISMAQVSIAWSVSYFFEGVSAPIVGTTSLANLAEAIAGAHIKLTEDEINYLEEPYQPMGIIGH
ncbi:NADP-dependent oxidoreductase domain-containing protein [Mycena galopus ATCC 62051]|nr:NADP-dependent oxidoreductase domain-containing protein [Mycena galopus ATCC 62051]